MKFCEKCGTQINDETTICSQCQNPISNYMPINMPQQSLPKKSKKMYLIIPLIILSTALITILVAYFVLPNNSESKDKTNSNSPISKVFNTTTDDECPEDEYGHHSWQSATCEHPSYCFNCGAYKDDKLGYHDFELDEETGLIKCWYCNMLKSDYDNEE